MSRNNNPVEYELIVAEDVDGITCHVKGNKIDRYLMYMTLSEYLAMSGELIDCITLMTNVLVRVAGQKGYNMPQTLRALLKVIESDGLATYMGRFGVSRPVDPQVAVKAGSDGLPDLDCITENIRSTIETLRTLVSHVPEGENQVIIPINVGTSKGPKS